MTETATEIRDRLAQTRTALANERTLLAYVRTALAMAISGVGALKLFQHGLTTILGWVLVGGGVVVLLLGAARYYAVARKVRSEID